MASIKDLFIKSISEGMKAADMIPDASSKANAYAEIAKALALTGQVKNDKGVEAEPIGKESLKPESTKGKGKKDKVKDAVQEPAPVEEAVSTQVEQEQEEIEAEATQEDETVVENLEQQAEEEAEVINNEEFTEEWTDDALASLANEIEFIGYLKESYDEDAISECISSFSEGLFNSLDDINPLNIKGFVAFMQCLIADAE